jgi:hypothetical protein
MKSGAPLRCAGLETLSVSSADTEFRNALPACRRGPYTFSYRKRIASGFLEWLRSSKAIGAVACLEEGFMSIRAFAVRAGRRSISTPRPFVGFCELLRRMITAGLR